MTTETDKDHPVGVSSETANPNPNPNSSGGEEEAPVVSPSVVEEEATTTTATTGTETTGTVTGTDIEVQDAMNNDKQGNHAVGTPTATDYGYESTFPSHHRASTTRRSTTRMSKRSSLLTEVSGGGNHHRHSRMSITAASAPFDKSYHPGKISFFAPPRQRQRWGDTQILPRLNWGDLFFDLFYVAATYNTSNILVDSPSWKGLLYFAGTIFPIMEIWLDKTYYDGRFVVGDDLYHRLAEMAGLVALASAVVHIRSVEVLSHPSEHVDMFGFCLSLATIELLLMLRHVEIYWFGIGERSTLQYLSVVEGLTILGAAIFYLAAAIVAGLEFFGENDDNKYDVTQEKDSYRTLAEAAGGYATLANDYGEEEEVTTTNIPILLCLLSMVTRLAFLTFRVVVLFPSDGTHKKFIVPTNVDFQIHRTGEWVMLMLGESILSILIVDVPSESGEYYSTFYCSLATVILLQYLHFRSQPHHADDHAARRDKNAGMAVIWLQHIYSASLIALGAAFTLFLIEFSYDDYDDGDYRRLVMDGLVSRTLAGGGAPKFDAEERQVRMGYVFSIALALIFFTLDAMSLCHVGWENGKHKCVCSKTKTKNIKGIVLVAFRAGVIAFVATLSQWISSPQKLAGTGLALTVLQIGIRYVGTIIFPSAQVHAFDGDEYEVSAELEDLKEKHSGNEVVEA